MSTDQTTTEQTGTTETTTESTTGATGTTTAPQDWRTTLPEDLRNLPSIQKFQTPDAMAKSYANLERLVGMEKIPMPKDKNDKAAWDTVWSRLGRPESPDKYQFKFELPDGVTVPEANVKAFAEAAHRLGMPQDMYAGVMELYQQMEVSAHQQRLEAQKESDAAAETELRRAYGSAYDGARSNVEAVIKGFIEPQDQELFLEGAKKDPRLFRALHNIAKRISSGDVKGIEKQYSMTPVEAQKEYDKVIADVKGPLYNSAHPEHEATKQRAFELLQMAQAGR